MYQNLDKLKFIFVDFNSMIFLVMFSFDVCKLTVTVCPCQSINVVDLGKRVLEEAVTAPPPKKSKAEKKVVPPPKVEESSEESDEEEVVCAADKCFLVL
jgi:hypothetical protein